MPHVLFFFTKNTQNAFQNIICLQLNHP